MYRSCMVARAALSELRARLRAQPDGALALAEHDPRATFGWRKEDGIAHTAAQLERLGDLQERLWAEGRRAVLIVLQGIDASGKDGTIRRVMSAFNPQGCTVSSFKVPTPEELAHDFLWRIHRRVPGKGEIGIFNRSHYEDVLVVRVKGLVPAPVWRARYRQIRDFEQLLSETGTTILKFFLHLSPDEQRERFQERYDNPRKRWKFSLGDLEERARWDEYMRAFEDALAKTSTDSAPWYVIPADRNWFRDLAVSTILAETLTEIDPQFPEPADLPVDLMIK
jgi:PPK2 family polyphosphate:nucleotide phosphotransferase